jgi:hypothetical protein
MTEFVRLAIQPDELAQSYRGRLARVNGWGSAYTTAKHLADWVKEISSCDERLCGVEVLAKVAGMDVTAFVRNHTMLPFRRAVALDHEDVPHGSAERRSLLEKRAYCATRKGLYFCRQCVAEDLKESGSPYWRRSHQLPGTLWCPVHETALASVKWTLEHMEIPHDCLETGVDVPHERFEIAKANPSIHRFIEICASFMGEQKPIHESLISKLVRDRYRKILLNPEQDVEEVNIAVKIQQHFDADWFTEVLVRREKSLNQTLKYLQDFFDRVTGNLNIVGYAMLLTVLYDTSDEALAEIKGLRSKTKQKRRDEGSSDQWQFDEKAMRIAYFSGHGNHVTIARAMGLSRHEVKRRMNVLGLPSLGRNNTSKLQSVIKNLLDGEMSLVQLCKLHGLQLNDTKCRLTEAMGPLFDAIPKLAARSQATKKLTQPRGNIGRVWMDVQHA